MIIIDSLKKNR